MTKIPEPQIVLGVSVSEYSWPVRRMNGPTAGCTLNAFGDNKMWGGLLYGNDKNLILAWNYLCYH